MTVHGEPFKGEFSCSFFESLQLAVEWEVFLPLMFAVLSTLWTIQKWWGGNFRWKFQVETIGAMSAKVGWTVEKCMCGKFFVWKFPVSRYEDFLNEFDVFTFFQLSNRSAFCLEKSVEWLKSYCWGYFSWKFPGYSPRMEHWKYWCFCFVPCNELNW
jgi:hypothetical protein